MSAPPQRRADASMTLLTEMLERPLDPGYAAAADRRQSRGLPPATSLRSVRLLLATVFIGLVIGGGASVLRASSSATNGARSGLIDQIEAGRASVEKSTQTANALQAQIAAADRNVLGAGENQLTTRLSVATGAVAVTGPGFTVTLTDAPDAQDTGDSNPRTGSSDQGRVQASDLQLVVNGLWQAGAEAIAINDQRLTATASIRFAGQAILVDFRPLTPPYVIRAIGDPKSLPASFADSPGATYAASLANYGIAVTTSTQKSLTLPGSATVNTRLATPANPTGDTGATSPSTPSESAQ